MRPSFIGLALALCLASPALAHEGEDHAAAPGTGSAAGSLTGPIEVSDVAQRNLGLAVAEAELRSVETTLRVIGEIQADPARSGTVSSRISGRVTAVFAQEGERVEKGQGLVEVESLQLGDPPPRARYASPVSGLVTDRHVVVGDDVEPNRHLLEVADGLDFALAQLHHVLDAFAGIDEAQAVVLQSQRGHGGKLLHGGLLVGCFIAEGAERDLRLFGIRHERHLHKPGWAPLSPPQSQEEHCGTAAADWQGAIDAG